MRDLVELQPHAAAQAGQRIGIDIVLAGCSAQREEPGLRGLERRRREFAGSRGKVDGGARLVGFDHGALNGLAGGADTHGKLAAGPFSCETGR